MIPSTLEAPVRQHLKNVYTCLSMSTLAAAAGGFVHVFTDILKGNFLTAILSIGLCLALHSIPHEPKKQNLRLGLMLGFGFLSGLGLGPLLDLAIAIEPSIVVTAFLITTVIFVCFTLTVLYSPSGQFLYLGGTLFSLLSALLLVQLFSLFTGSVLFFKAYIYAGLCIFCGFVLYDTDKIIVKRRLGDSDYIKHSLDLFMDLIQIFRHIVVILLQSQDTKRKKKERD